MIGKPRRAATMDRRTAVKMWERLEEERDTSCEGDPPIYDVRLDAKSSGMSDNVRREYTVRVTPAKSAFMDRDRWLYVLEVAGELGVDEVDVENNGMMIT
jgi:hypothetical protein